MCFLPLPLSGLKRQVSCIGLTRGSPTFPLRVRASEPWAATARGLPHSLSKHYTDLLLPLSLGALDRKGLMVFIC